MQTQDAIDLIRDSLFQVFVIAGPILFLALVIGLILGVVQSVFQIQDSSLSVVPRLLLVGFVLILILPWMVERLVDYSHDVIHRIPHVVSHQGQP
jgi:flagellar biosynthetic protein FliQ